MGGISFTSVAEQRRVGSTEPPSLPPRSIRRRLNESSMMLRTRLTFPRAGWCSGVAIHLRRALRDRAMVIGWETFALYIDCKRSRRPVQPSGDGERHDGNHLCFSTVQRNV